MTDITSRYLEAAFIDQHVAGQFADKAYAFVAVVNGGAYQLGVAVANESGYNPIAKTFATWDEARQWASELNAHIGLSEVDALAIVGSTMRGPRVIN
jgi:hypothetical protein